jgi:DNA-binding HxlR family transcriptional regulator
VQLRFLAMSSRRASAREQQGETVAIELLAQRWTIFILREIFLGAHRFGQIQRNLGIASNVLTGRLQALVEEGILSRRRYRTDPDWYEYALTPRAIDLFPVILAICWSPRDRAAVPPDAVLHHLTCGHETTPVVVCEQ